MKNRRIQKLLAKTRRAIVRIVFSPITLVKESTNKNRLREFILKGQNSLPVEFVVNEGDTVVQVGTPWPRTVDRYLRAIGESGTLIVFEANPHNHKNLKKHIDSAGVQNVILVQGAACNDNGEGKLMLSPHPGDHKIAVPGIRMDNDFRKGNECMEEADVQFHRVEDALEQQGIKTIDYICITVNGAEAEVLKGAESMLKSASRYTRVFAKGHALNENDIPINEEISTLLQSYGYRTMVTKGEASSADDNVWLERAGDVFGWKQAANA